MIGIISDYGMIFLIAMGRTLLLALLGLLFGSILGIIFGLMSVIDNKFFRAVALVYVNLVRAVPMIVLAFFVYIGVPYAFNNTFDVRIKFSSLTAGTICLAVNCGAYMAEIIRAGIQSIDPGQLEAARSLGLPYWRSMYHVVMPQAIRNMVPSIVNQFIITIKDTSILSVIGFPELVNKAQNVIAITFRSFEVWTIVAVMYLVVILILQYIAKKLEKKLNHA